jgi:hypothetical protein
MGVVILRVTSGKHEGEKVVLDNGRSAIVGSALPSRLAIAEDEALAKVHFSLQFIGGRCRVLDLNTPTGTFLNGEKVTEADVPDGAEIKAGDTTFLVKFVDAAAGAGATPAATAPSASRPRQAASAQASPRPGPARVPAPMAGIAVRQLLGGLQLQEEACFSGLVRFTAASGGLAPAALLRLLNESIPLTALVNLGKLAIPPPADVKVREFLLEWMPSNLVAANSPWILCPGDSGEFFELLEKGWGGGGVVCVLSRARRGELVAHLRAAALMWDVPPPGAAPRSVIGLYLPAAMSGILQNASKDLVGKLMVPIDAVVVECDRAPGGWELFAGEAFRDVLTRMGASCSPKEKPKEGPPEKPEGDAKEDANAKPK